MCALSQYNGLHLLTQMDVLGKGDFVNPDECTGSKETCSDGCNKRLVECGMGRMCLDAKRMYGTDVPGSNSNCSTFGQIPGLLALELHSHQIGLWIWMLGS